MLFTRDIFILWWIIRGSRKVTPGVHFLTLYFISCCGEQLDYKINIINFFFFFSWFGRRRQKGRRKRTRMQNWGCECWNGTPLCSTVGEGRRTDSHSCLDRRIEALKHRHGDERFRLDFVQLCHSVPRLSWNFSWIFPSRRDVKASTKQRGLRWLQCSGYDVKQANGSVSCQANHS